MDFSIKVPDDRSIHAAFSGKSLAGKKTVNGVMGYTAPYAVYVHENLEYRHKIGKTAKFIERPYRKLSKQMRLVVVKNLNNKESLKTSVRRALDLLKTDSMAVVPIRTGFLRNSAFVRVD